LPKAKGKAKEESLEGIPVDIQEAIILEDLLFILMVRPINTFNRNGWLTRVDKGIEGNYITYHPEYSPEDDDPLQGIRFVASSSLGISILPIPSARLTSSQIPHYATLSNGYCH
jgi:gamma-tubulin complex component 2